MEDEEIEEEKKKEKRVYSPEAICDFTCNTQTQQTQQTQGPVRRRRRKQQEKKDVVECYKGMNDHKKILLHVIFEGVKSIFLSSSSLFLPSSYSFLLLFFHLCLNSSRQ